MTTYLSNVNASQVTTHGAARAAYTAWNTLGRILKWLAPDSPVIFTANTTATLSARRYWMGGSGVVANLTLTLPVAPPSGTAIVIRNANSTYTCTVAAGAGATIQAMAPLLQDDCVTVIYEAALTKWYVEAESRNLRGLAVLTGVGTPESVVTAPIGSLYLRTNGTAFNTLYVKESGVGNTGWVGK